MKTLGLKLFSAVMLGSVLTSGAQSYEASVPGDNFSLEGALELFKKSTSPEDFERLLNASDSKVNNLDLNGDGEVDYIRVIDRNDGNVHIFILQAVVSGSENQDVATIELEKLENGKAVLQITGDEDIYGIETIIEPTEEVRINAGATTTRTVVNVWAWPSVQYVYSPYYTVWVSPWHWHLRPVWWRSCRPIVYYDYYSYWTPYRPYYATCHSHRIVRAQAIYRPHRTTSGIVHSRHHTQVVGYREAHQRDSGIRHNRSNEHERSDHRSSERQTPTRRTSQREFNSGRETSDREVKRSGSFEPRQRDTESAERRRSTSRENNFSNRSEQRSAPAVSQRSVEPKRESAIQRSKPASSNRSYQPRETRSSKSDVPSGTGNKRSSTRGKRSD